MTRSKAVCMLCKKEIEIKEIKKVGKLIKCPECYRLRRKERRTETKQAVRVARIPKVIKPKEKKRYYNLNFEEKKILLKQLMKMGYEFEEAKERVNSLTNYEKGLFKKLKQEDNLNKIFKKDFEKLLIK